MLQFCKENNLTSTLHSLQQESNVVLNSVDNMKSFTNDILSGKWDSVLKQVKQMSLPKSKLTNLYEQVSNQK
jgi:WD40 repeat-containing protein SMU1